MNDRKFCFIICTNDDLLLEECLHYINHLSVPEGYEIELLTISDATSMTQGYQEAMQQSKAKYKIYMHQDVFVLNRNLLSDLLKIFQADSQIGLIGMIGYEYISPNGIMWHMPRCGSIYTSNPKTSYADLTTYQYSITLDGFTPVAEVDGFFMATSYDIPWNTQHLTGWDFYDAFQSIDFLKRGFKVVVPNQRHPWCIHDDGKILNMFHYDIYRQLFLKLYKDVLGKRYSEVLSERLACRKDK